jgi:hypothetical protein
MNATVDLSISFYTVPDDSAVAMWADRRQRVDRALEAIECVTLSGYHHFKRLVIFIFTNFACSHTQFFRASPALRRCSFDFKRVEITREGDTFPWRRLWKYQGD